MALYEGTAGDIWVTTRGGGLNRFHDGKWSTFTTRHGMVEDFVAGVADDNDGHLWIAYPRGVMRIPRAEFDQIEAGSRSTLQPRIFNQSDGLPRGEISPEGRPNIFRARDGRILFGTDLGVAVIDPRSVHLNPLKPPTYIERVMINGSAADLSKAIVVPAGTNDLQIYYTAISLLAPEKVKFKIRLAPLDRDWIDADGSRDVRYAKLPAGHYTFQVKACNNDGVWSDEERRIGFRVRPYFYQTGWFVGLGVISIAGASFGIVHLRARLARRRMAMLENVVNVRTSELSLKTALLEAQLDSSPEGVLVVNTRRERVLQNRQFSELWKIPRDIAEDPDTERQVQFVRSQVKNQKQFIERVRHLYAHPDETSRDEVELCDGTFLDRYSAPVRGKDGQHYGRIWTVRDVTAQKLAQQQLLEASRQAGMAEIATGVLHNIGNVLNSVNVSATLVRDQVRTSKAANLTRVGALLREKSDDLPGFLTSDPRGSMLPAYVVSLSEHLETERNETLREIDGLRKNIEHIKDIVAMQQSHAKGAGLTEKVCVTELIEDALRITGGSLARHGVQLVRDFRSTPELIVQRHKVVQILVNLLRNAKQACSESGRPDKHVSVRIVESGPFLEIAVVDNGAGIAAENLTRIFAHGFTTRTNGHGFGLHSGALAARELGGSLSVRSDGPGRGATFTLKLPLTLDSAPA
jgi:signal transduction histidine kinase